MKFLSVHMVWVTMAWQISSLCFINLFLSETSQFSDAKQQNKRKVTVGEAAWTSE